MRKQGVVLEFMYFPLLVLPRMNCNLSMVYFIGLNEAIKV